jgi:hypothetical protein
MELPGTLILGINLAKKELLHVEKKLQQKVVYFLARCGFVLTEIPVIMKSGDAFHFKKNCKSLVTDMPCRNEPTYDAVCSLGCDYWFCIHLNDVLQHFSQIKERRLHEQRQPQEQKKQQRRDRNATSEHCR